jgi:hypothetical protein
LLTYQSSSRYQVCELTSGRELKVEKHQFKTQTLTIK